MIRRAAKLDNNHPEIVAELEAVGCLVTSAAAMGNGFPDLVVQRAGQIYLIEVKNPEWRGKLTQKQLDFIAKGWIVSVVTCVTEALYAVGLRKSGGNWQ